MKICPRCQRTYTDDNLNFCLDDGAVLQQQSAAGSEPPATVFMNQPPPTNPQASPMSQPTIQPAWNTAPQQFGAPPRKSSKAWIWVLLILGLVVLTCGGGLVGFFIYVASQADNNTVVSNSTTNTGGTRTTGGNKTSTTNTTSSTNTSSTSSDSTRTNVEDIDLSDWVRENSTYGNTEFTGGEFMMASKQKDFYYVLVAPDEYSTENANTRVTLRNVNNMDSRFGYGLIFHSNPSPLVQDYAFLIDTKKKKYRVVRHEPSSEKTVVAWTNSDAIKDGTQENLLEVRDRPSQGKVELYINGQLVNTIPNTYGYKGGVPGLYSGDQAKIAFKNLQIAK